jgi:hypothetical protein
VTNAFDAYLRRTAVGLSTQPATLTQYGFDVTGRMLGVTNGNYNALYTYLANSPLVSQITFRSNSTTRMVTTSTSTIKFRDEPTLGIPSPPLEERAREGRPL